MQKKVLIITLEYPPLIGGIATYVHDLAAALDPTQTIVLAPPHGSTAAWDEHAPYRVVRKPLLYPKWIWPRWTRACFHILRLCAKERVGLIIIHHVLPLGYAGILARALKKIPFLLFSHGTDLITGTKNPWKKKMADSVCKRAEQIVVNSESLKLRFLRTFPQYESKTLVLYPCPEDDFLSAPDQAALETLRAKDRLEGKRVILSVSRLDEGKGFPHLIRIMPQILKQAPHLVWFIIGDGPKRTLVTELVQKYSLQNVVRYVGLVPHEEIKPYYYLADFFVLLTHPDEGREEGLGLVFLEAAAAGIPVIAGKSGGVEEAVVHGKTGLVYDTRQQAKAITDAMVEILTNDEYRARLGAQAKERIAAEFRWPHQIAKLRPWLT